RLAAAQASAAGRVTSAVMIPVPPMRTRCVGVAGVGVPRTIRAAGGTSGSSVEVADHAGIASRAAAATRTAAVASPARVLAVAHDCTRLAATAYPPSATATQARAAAVRPSGAE